MMGGIPRRISERERDALLRAKLTQWQFDVEQGRRKPRRVTEQQVEAVLTKPARVMRRRKLTPMDEAGVKALLARGTPHHDIAHRYGVSVSVVGRIRRESMAPKPRGYADWRFVEGAWVRVDDDPALSSPAAL